MDNSKSTIESYLRKLDLTKQEIVVFMNLLEFGPMTNSDLSKRTKIPRASIYNYIQNLKDNGLVEELIDEFHRKNQVSGIDKIEELLIEQKNKINYLTEKFPIFSDIFANYLQKKDPLTNIRFYTGKAGIKRMVWQILKAENEVVGFTIDDLESFCGESFMNNLWRNFEKRKLKLRDIISDKSIVKNPLRSGFSKNFHAKNMFETRYLSKEVLDINLQTDIYNNNFAIYNSVEGEIFGVLIENRKIAKLQKQIFEILWRQAEQIKI